MNVEYETTLIHVENERITNHNAYTKITVVSMVDYSRKTQQIFLNISDKPI